MTTQEIDCFVSVVNTIVEKYCEKYPDEYEYDNLCIGYSPLTGEVACMNGDDLDEHLEWINTEVLPDLLNL